MMRRKRGGDMLAATGAGDATFLLSQEQGVPMPDLQMEKTRFSLLEALKSDL